MLSSITETPLAGINAHLQDCIENSPLDWNSAVEAWWSKGNHVIPSMQ